MRAEIDVNATRAALRFGARLVTENGTTAIPLLVLDTGQAFDLLLPISLVHQADRDNAARVPVRTLGGPVTGMTFSAQLEIEGLPSVRVDAVGTPNDFWLVGMPVLRRLHLHLHPDERGCSWLIHPR